MRVELDYLPYLELFISTTKLESARNLSFLSQYPSCNSRTVAALTTSSAKK